jgi:Mce-associated membrane protein
VKRILPAVTLVLATTACTVTGTATPVPGAGNLAVIDPSGTTAALAGVKTAAEAVLSYDSADPGAFDKAAGANLTDAAKSQLTVLFDAIRKSPQPVRLTSRVVRASALELTGNRIRELAVVEQVNGGSTGLATVAFTALKAAGRWRISDIAVNPAQPPPAPHADDGSPAGLRDSALAGARAVAAALFATDSADPEGTYARAEAAIAEPLLSDYRAKKAAYLDAIRKSATKVVLGPSPMAGVTALSGGRASVLFATTLQVTDTAGKLTSRPFTTELDLVRQGAGWNATTVRPVTAS